MPTKPDSRLMHPGPGWSGRFFSTSNFDLWYFCSLLTYKGVQYLIWKIWLISIWILKAKVMAWLLTWFIFAQSTLISCHTEAFVKTEVACTLVFFIGLCIVLGMPYVLVPTVVQWKHLNVDIALISILKIITRFMMSILPRKLWI